MYVMLQVGFRVLLALGVVAGSRRHPAAVALAAVMGWGGGGVSK
jgi:hypothetical protein